MPFMELCSCNCNLDQRGWSPWWICVHGSFAGAFCFKNGCINATSAKLRAILLRIQLDATTTTGLDIQCLWIKSDSLVAVNLLWVTTTSPNESFHVITQCKQLVPS